MTARVERLAGVDRYATAAAVSTATFTPGVPVVFLASGAGTTDALAAGAAAARARGPVLLTGATTLPGSTRVRARPPPTARDRGGRRRCRSQRGRGRGRRHRRRRAGNPHRGCRPDRHRSGGRPHIVPDRGAGGIRRSGRRADRRSRGGGGRSRSWRPVAAHHGRRTTDRHPRRAATNPAEGSRVHRRGGRAVGCGARRDRPARPHGVWGRPRSRPRPRWRPRPIPRAPTPCFSRRARASSTPSAAARRQPASACARAARAPRLSARCARQRAGQVPP